MTDLTEKWKKGELKAGYYYVKNEFGNIFPSDYSEEYDSINDCGVLGFWNEVSEITEVLTEVPTYEEYQALLSDSLAKNEGVEINAELKAENKSLKEDRENYIELCERLLTISEKEWENLVKTGSRKQQIEWLNNRTKTSFINLLNLYECQKEDCKTLAQTLLKVSPEHREWLEVNFKEYL